MNDLEQRLSYPFLDELPAPGTARPVAPGIFWARLPLPFALDHVNVWLLRDAIDGRAGWTIIDCGISRDSVQALWEQIFDATLEGLPVLRVLVTHFHPDHLGLAHWLCSGGSRARWQAPLWMTLGEYMVGRLMAAGHSAGANAGGEASARFYARHGMVDEGALAQIRSRSDYYPAMVPAVPAQYTRMTGGDRIAIGGRDWQVIIGYGHSVEHCALYSEAAGVLIAGDMVLPRISTNVSSSDMEPDGNPLGAYLDSLGRYEPLPVETLVLPSHGKPFTGLHERIAQLRAHHAARLDEVLAACREAPRSAADIVPLMFRRALDSHQLTFAMGEALAHLKLLRHQGKLRETVSDGVMRFAAAG
jgi:glyoxylase-like metal-dependent hydrolase (beta-lactamase superfamily II)